MEFEKFTSGFGSKMLEKMGFSGRLGKNETGREEPIDTEKSQRDTRGLGVSAADAYPVANWQHVAAADDGEGADEGKPPDPALKKRGIGFEAGGTMGDEAPTSSASAVAAPAELKI